MDTRTESPAPSRHPFARAGYAAPYTFRATLEKSYRAGDEMKPAGTCDVCGTCCRYMARWSDAAGVQFDTGLDCAAKAHVDFDSATAEMLREAKKTMVREARRAAREEKRAAAREAREAREAEEAREAQVWMDTAICEFEGYAHPSPVRAAKGESYADYLRWCMANLSPRAVYDKAHDARVKLERGELEPVRQPLPRPDGSSEYVGKVKDRLSLSVLCVGRAAFETMYGVTFVDKFLDVDGNYYVWKGKGIHVADEEGQYIETVGRYFEIKGTVKAHDLDRYADDAKATYLTRVKVVSVGGKFSG